MVETKGDKLSNSVSTIEETRILGGKDGLSDEWDKTAKMLRKRAETVLRVIFGNYRKVQGSRFKVQGLKV